MARKKSKRTNISQAALDRARREAAGDLPVAPPPAAKISKSGKVQTEDQHKTTLEDLAKEYAYVLTDLRSMGVLAGALFAVLIVLSFII
jgi:hypothetical protein